MVNSSQTCESSSELFPVVIGLIHMVSPKAKQVEITPDSLLLEELALDSLDMVRVLMLIEDRYQLSIDLDEVPKMKRVIDLTELLDRELRAAA
jgi:acyl carrier protein